MRAQANGVRFVLAFVRDERLYQFFGKVISLQKVRVVLFQAIERLFERRRQGRNIFHFFGRKIVDVLVERLAWIDFV